MGQNVCMEAPVKMQFEPVIPTSFVQRLFRIGPLGLEQIDPSGRRIDRSRLNSGS